MSCSNSTSPIDITGNSSGICDLKCKYSFKYNDSTTTIENKSTYLSLSYEKPNIDPVMYNSTSYYVEEIRIYSPSIHKYDGTNADAELIIIHSSDYAGKLLVCVPIVSTSKEISPLDIIVTTASQFANSSGKKTFLTKSFNLNVMVPNKKMYTYSGTLPFNPCDGEHNIITFNKKDDAYISLSTTNLNLLKTIISKHNISIKKNTYYVNNNGPTSNFSNENDSDIYIDCKPVSEDGNIIGEDKENEMKTPLLDLFVSKVNYKTIFNNIYLQIFISIIAAFIIYKLFLYLMDTFKSEDKVTSFSNYIMPKLLKPKKTIIKSQ